MNILIKFDEKTAKDWQRMIGKINMSAKLFEYKCQPEYMHFAEDAYCFRQELIGCIERKFLAPIVLIRNKYDLSIHSSYNLILIAVDDTYISYELEFLKNSEISFIMSNGEHSDDMFGTDATMIKLLKDYDATQPPKMGFTK